MSELELGAAAGILGAGSGWSVAGGAKGVSDYRQVLVSWGRIGNAPCCGFLALEALDFLLVPQPETGGCTITRNREMHALEIRCLARLTSTSPRFISTTCFLDLDDHTRILHQDADQTFTDT